LGSKEENLSFLQNPWKNAWMFH